MNDLEHWIHVQNVALLSTLRGQQQSMPRYFTISPHTETPEDV
jgi:hypothetical protein